LQHASGANRLVASLPLKDRQRLVASCKLVNLTRGDVLWQPQTRIRHAYFPIEAAVAQLMPVYGHLSLQVALIGSEGLLGVPLLLGIDVPPLLASVQATGLALQITAASFRRELAFSAALRRSLNRYVFVLMSQLAQSTTCMRFHGLDARLARWLLLTRDCVHSNEFHITHELLAQMLGVRRVGVTNAAGLLKRRRLISYRRGNVIVLDGDGLQATACGCYQDGKDVYNRMLK
jgi:CRP-like cAMP-binding protein